MVLDAGGRRRTMDDNGLVCRRSAVEVTTTGISAMTVAVDDRRPAPLMTEAKDDRQVSPLTADASDRRAALVTAVADDRGSPLPVTGAADDRRIPLLVTVTGSVSATSSDAYSAGRSRSFFCRPSDTRWRWPCRAVRSVRDRLPRLLRSFRV